MWSDLAALLWPKPSDLVALFTIQSDLAVLWQVHTGIFGGPLAKTEAIWH